MTTVPNDSHETGDDHGHDSSAFSPTQGTLKRGFPIGSTENPLRTSIERSNLGTGKTFDSDAVPPGPELAPGGEEPMPLESFSSRYEKKISSNVGSKPGSAEYHLKKNAKKSLGKVEASRAISPGPELAPVGEEPVPPEAMSSRYEKKIASHIGVKTGSREHNIQRGSRESPEMAKASNAMALGPELAPEGEEPIPLESFSSRHEQRVSGQSYRKIEEVSNGAHNQGPEVFPIEDPTPVEFASADNRLRKLDASRTGSPVTAAERASVSVHVERRAQVETLDANVIGGEANIEEYSTPGLTFVDQPHLNTDFRQEEKVDEDETCDVGVAIDEADGIVGGVTNEDGSPIAAFKVEDQDEVDRRVRERVLAKSISVEGHVLADIGKDGEDATSRWWKKKWLVAVALVVVGSIIALILVPTLGSSSPQNDDFHAAPPSDGVTPTACPSSQPSLAPTVYPTALPSDSPMPSTAPSMEPSNTPTSNRFALLKGKISSISSEESLADTTSPQYKALTWLADDDDASLDADDDSARIITRYALAVLYFSTGGPEWRNSHGFLSNQHACLWSSDDECEDNIVGWQNSYGANCEWHSQGNNCYLYGATSFNFDTGYSADDACCACGGVYCTQSANGPVLTKINLANNNLTGSLPEEVGALSGLVDLSLQHNHLQGSIPSGITLLRSLETLRLRYNGLSGTLPSLIGHMSHLQTIDLDSNQLSGSIPDSIGDLSDLTMFSMAFNHLNGTIPHTIGSMNSLSDIYLLNNQLSGSLPPSIGNLTNLVTFIVSANKITGEIPTWLNQLNGLTHLWLNHNAFTGTIPSFDGGLSSLLSLALTGNMLTGDITPSIGALSSLEQLYLQYNSLSGTIPSDILRLRSLRELGLSFNSLNGTIPSGLGDIPAIDWFSVSYNNMTGPIPESLGKLEHLTALTLRHNKFTGTLPNELGTLSKLEAINIGENRFTGTIPSTLGGLSQLANLHLENNFLHGSIPPSFKSFVGENSVMVSLLLHVNNLEGDMNFLCDEDSQNQIFLMQADCEGEEPEVHCDCCNLCCDRENNCNPV